MDSGGYGLEAELGVEAVGFAIGFGRSRSLRDCNKGLRRKEAGLTRQAWVGVRSKWASISSRVLPLVSGKKKAVTRR
jgi:hypothetical protein